MAKDQPEVGDKVSWNWGGGAPGGTVSETKSDGEMAIKSKRGNTIKKKADPDNPAVHVSRAGNDVVKRASELTVEEKGGGSNGGEAEEEEEEEEEEEKEEDGGGGEDGEEGHEKDERKEKKEGGEKGTGRGKGQKRKKSVKEADGEEGDEEEQEEEGDKEEEEEQEEEDNSGKEVKKGGQQANKRRKKEKGQDVKDVQEAEAEAEDAEEDKDDKAEQEDGEDEEKPKKKGAGRPKKGDHKKAAAAKGGDMTARSTRSKDKNWDFFVCYADRAALVFVANLPLLYLLSAKNQPVKFLTGRSYETLNLFHRRAATPACRPGSTARTGPRTPWGCCGRGAAGRCWSRAAAASPWWSRWPGRCCTTERGGPVDKVGW
ncbi:hypothetical protein P8C59_007718 [Phyllachora maydis]|uniref:Hypervirulence associated protein TUDOR domain-containing protein n=1 Tax=Phyllachora maydis TaxID=1825666 RepID=A0AAD9I935_9PEZI|nr:hypothetical protein P8C59_007718 [Phyllachora maydis]